MLANDTSLLRSMEGFRSRPYKCSAGVWTIGYGTTNINGTPVTPSTPPISEARAIELLESYITAYIDPIFRKNSLKLTQNQYNALTCFVYNIGFAAFSKSTMLKLLVQGDIAGAANEFPKWNKVNGKPNKGLTNRRIKERDLFLQD